MSIAETVQEYGGVDTEGNFDHEAMMENLVAAAEESVEAEESNGSLFFLL